MDHQQNCWRDHCHKHLATTGLRSETCFWLGTCKRFSTLCYINSFNGIPMTTHVQVEALHSLICFPKSSINLMFSRGYSSKWAVSKESTNEEPSLTVRDPDQWQWFMLHELYIRWLWKAQITAGLSPLLLGSAQLVCHAVHNCCLTKLWHSLPLLQNQQQHGWQNQQQHGWSTKHRADLLVIRQVHPQHHSAPHGGKQCCKEVCYRNIHSPRRVISATKTFSGCYEDKFEDPPKQNPPA